MEQGKKQLRVITNHQSLLKEVIDWYNSVYKTDFMFLKFVHDEVNFAIIEYLNASENQVFDLGRIYGNEQIKRNLSNNKIVS